MTAADGDLAVAVSLDMKVNLGNYESASVFLSLSGVKPGTTLTEIESALDTGRLAYDAIRARLRQNVAEIKERNR